MSVLIMLTSHFWCSIKSSFETLLDSHTHAPTHIIPSFMWSALGIISILHGKRQLAGKEGGNGQSIPSHRAVLCLHVWVRGAVHSMSRHMAAVSTPHFFSCGPDSLGPDSTHAGPRDNHNPPPPNLRIAERRRGQECGNEERSTKGT